MTDIKLALFIPLRGEHFERFADGTKDTEFRRYGLRWNEEVCRIGRPVVLSNGYGNHRRMTGTIIGFERRIVDSPEWISCYGEPGMAACIKIKIGDALHASPLRPG